MAVRSVVSAYYKWLWPPFWANLLHKFDSQHSFDAHMMCSAKTTLQLVYDSALYTNRPLTMFLHLSSYAHSLYYKSSILDANHTQCTHCTLMHACCSAVFFSLVWLGFDLIWLHFSSVFHASTVITAKVTLIEADFIWIKSDFIRFDWSFCYIFISLSVISDCVRIGFEQFAENQKRNNKMRIVFIDLSNMVLFRFLFTS